MIVCDRIISPSMPIAARPNPACATRIIPMRFDRAPALMLRSIAGSAASRMTMMLEAAT